MRAVAWIGCLACAAAAASAGDWRQFRGTENNSIVLAPDELPAHIDLESTVAWRVELPGKGPSSPIVVGDQVIVTAGGGRRQTRLYVLSFDKETGEEQWRREFWATGRTLSHPITGMAAPTPASDGQFIYAFYSSNDLVCLDLAGNLIWYRGLAHDYPKAGNDVGMSSSPVVALDTVIVQVDNQGDSFAAGIDVRTGKNRWRIPRDRVASWSSPVLLQTADKEPVVLLQSMHGVSAHEIRTGKEIWRYETACDAITSPTPLGDKVLLPSRGLLAIEVPEPGGEPRLLWESNQLAPSAASPTAFGGDVYTVNRSGVLNRGRLSDGEVIWKTRLGIGQQWTTPLITATHAYCFDSNGKAAVVELGEKPKVVCTMDFGETIQASPAVSDGAIYVRTDSKLWKIAD